MRRKPAPHSPVYVQRRTYHTHVHMSSLNESYTTHLRRTSLCCITISSRFTALHAMQTRSSDENSVRPSVRPSVRLSVCPSVCLSNACIVTKRKKDLSRFLYHTKDHLAYFSEKKNGWWGRPLLPEMLDHPAPVEAKSPIFNRYSFVVHYALSYEP